MVEYSILLGDRGSHRGGSPACRQAGAPRTIEVAYPVQM